MGTDKNKNGSGTGKGLASQEDNLIYIQVPDMTLSELAKAGRARIDLNEEEISLIYVNGKSKEDGKVHATQAKCPHAGGPLHLADIEDIPEDGGLCIKCPWHSWKFNLSSGKCVCPAAGHGKQIKIYPVRISGQEIRVGFDSIAEDYFSTPPK